MSIYQKASLVQIPSGYKAADDKLYSVVPSNGDGDFTIDSDADATRVNKDGLIESVVADQARLDYDPSSPQDPHLLLEPTRTNLQVRSEEFDNAAWTKSNVTVSANQTTSPDGAITADKIIENSGSGSKKVYDSITTSSGTAYTWSVFLKADTRSKARLNIFGAYAEFDVANQTLLTQSGITSYKIEDYGNGWGRFSITETANSSSTLTYVYLLDDAGNVSYTGDGTSGLFVWGAQLEAGTYPTSYIPTTIAVTRTEDFISNSYTGLTGTSGTIFIDLDTKGFDSSFSKIIALRDTVTGDSLRLEPFDSSGIKKFAFFGINGSSATPPSEDILPINNRKKIALTFDSGNFKYASDGVITTGTYSGTARQYNQIGGANITGGAMHNAIIHQFMVFNEALSDAELQTLTT